LHKYITCAFVKRLCKSFCRRNDLQNRFTENPERKNRAERFFAQIHNLRFCKTTLQVVLSAKRFAKSFYRKSGLRKLSAARPCAFVKRLCKSFCRRNDLQNRFTENPECKNRAKRFFASCTPDLCFSRVALGYIRPFQHPHV
jgi:hypothetical protein